MFSWITGPRVTNAIEDLQADAGYETTFIEPPETPAHQFAVRAFKHAIFGTPAPDEAGKKLQKKQSPDASNTKAPEIAVPKENGPLLSPSKQPGGILRTPMTANKAQKSVSFGAHVVDNEGKRGNAGKSGIPNDCPGKFPSPWTPGTELKADAESEKKPRTKLTTALLEARTTPQLKPGQRAKARDDSDITLDLGAPRSESGRYWKEQYESYTEKSEREVRKLVAKQQLAKNYAKKKDGEVTELVTKLEQERKRYRRRELELEQQNKDLQERLRQAMAERLSSSVEVAALKNRIAALEQSIVAPSSDVMDSKPSFQIYEDSSKNAANPSSEQDTGPEASYLSQRARVFPVGKENSPPRSRHARRQTLPDTSSRPTASYTATARLGVEADQVSTILAKSPRASARKPESTARPNLALPSSDRASKSPLGTRRTDPGPDNLPPKSPALVLPSSPLPIPSPGIEDPWVVNADESSIAPADKFALPISSGPSYPRAAGVGRRLHRVSKSVSQATKTDNSRHVRKTEARVAASSKSRAPELATTTEKPNTRDERPVTITPPATEELPAVESSSFDAVLPTPTDPKFDIANITAHHAEGSSQVKRDRVQVPVDRKEEARRRLQEKKQRKQQLAK
ncbi:hypothetical protein K458DRAFT_394394 [Lentithecium fluviatile CBS 122367]|uniref:Spindle pole body-associated protein cut12 domain-containing protein n=1 Tax=Lentithecium fluviatile CBS 122367 TaxID=1168545 RepID=A0A6G1IL70_9PLEO|nr:hypothetical protein K458DRAFT_394394 [Lentithecium fluviatile CBS 122367]